MNNHYIKVETTVFRNIIITENYYLLQIMDYKFTTSMYK